jgi:uncharacterized LabA/DUF88 family protein
LEKIAVLIDGAYFDKIRFHDHGNAKIDVEKLANEMSCGKNLTNIFYYHCLPYQSSPPTLQERSSFSSKQKFFASISTIPLLTLRQGNIALVSSCICGKQDLRQKRVDSMICVDIASLSLKKKVENISILTGDSDFIPAIELAKSEGVTTILWHGDVRNKDSAPSRDLMNIVNLPLFLSPAIVAQILRTP